MSNNRYARRDGLVVKMANAVLRLASKKYQDDLKATIRYGLDYFPPLFLGALRFLVLALPVLLFVRPPKGPVK